MNVNGRSKIGKKQEGEVEKKERSMKTITIISLLCLGMFLVIGTGVAFAANDSDTETSNVSLTIPHAVKLVISNPDATKTLGQDGTAESAFDADYVALDADNPHLKVSANKSWKLSAQMTAWTAPYGKAAGDLQIKDAGLSHVTVSAFTSLSNTVDLVIAEHTVGVKNEDHPIQYGIKLDYTKDVPGDYSTIVTYTLATQG